MRNPLWTVCACIVAAGLLVGCGGGGSGGPGGGGEQPLGDSANSSGLIVRTAASADYESISLGQFTGSNLSFTGLYHAWFTLVKFQPAPGWICGQGTNWGDLVVSREDGSALHKVFHSDHSSSNYMRWSPDGTEIVFSLAGETINRIRVRDRTIQRLAFNGGFATVQGMAWSPDGRIYASLKINDQWDIYYFLADQPGCKPIRVTNSADIESNLDVSPDGGFLVWSSQPTANDDSDILMMPVDGDPSTDAIPIANDPNKDEWVPKWSPDGRRIAYVGGDDLYVYDVTDGSSQQLTDIDNVNTCAWSSDGRYVLFTVGPHDLYKIPFDGSPGDETLVRADWGNEVDGMRGLRRPRTLIGAPGSDWDGNDPPFGSQRAGIIVATDGLSVRSAVSFQVPSNDTVMLTDRTPPGSENLVVCEARAAQLQRVLEDNGPGEPKNVWNFLSYNPVPGEALIAFDATSGKVRSVMAGWDQVGSSAAHGPRVSLEGGRLIIRGAALRAYDARGRLVSGPRPVSRVVLDGRTGEFIGGSAGEE